MAAITLQPFGKRYNPESFNANMATIQNAFATADDAGKAQLYRLMAKEYQKMAKFWNAASATHEQLWCATTD